jgi:hypothetical protein
VVDPAYGKSQSQRGSSWPSAVLPARSRSCPRRLQHGLSPPHDNLAKMLCRQSVRPGQTRHPQFRLCLRAFPLVGHQVAQHFINARLIASAIDLKPRQYVCIQAQSDWFLNGLIKAVNVSLPVSAGRRFPATRSGSQTAWLSCACWLLIGDFALLCLLPFLGLCHSLLCTYQKMITICREVNISLSRRSA